MTNPIISTVYAEASATTINSNLSLVDIFQRLMTNLILPLLGALAIGGIIWGGILFMMSQGDAEKVKTARNAILWSVLGVVLIASSYAIVVYLIKLVNN